MEVYLVGGAVRDSLLEIPFEEKDWVVVGSSPEELSELGYKPVGSQFPVFLHPDTKEEYALARTERKSGKGHKGFIFYTDPTVTLEEDLVRRDITINAIAQDNRGKLIDPFNGQKDIQERKIRKVSDAFREDPLRVFRVSRFMAKLHHLDFTIEEETLNAMNEIVLSGELETLPKERIWMETIKALRCESPDKYFETLKSCEALDSLIKEEVLDVEALSILKSKTKNPEMRWAGLLRNTTEIRIVNNLFNCPKSFVETSEVFHKLNSFILDQNFVPEKILELLLKTDAIRRPQRFMIAEEIFKLLNTANNPIKWKDLLSNLSNLKPTSVNKDGGEIAKEIKEMRLEAITKSIKEI